MTFQTLSTVLVCITLLCQHISASPPACPSMCSRCQHDTNGSLVRLTCQNVAIQSLPDTLVQLRVSDAHGMTLPLGQLRSFHLAGKSGLQVLSVQRYRVRDIHVGAFRGCPDLTVLDLSNNLLKEIHDGTFQVLHSLKYLNLNQNKLSKITPAMLQGLVALQELSLALNRFTSLINNTFHNQSSLTSLDLQSNLIRHIETEAFSGLDKVWNLNLENNKLTVIQDGVFSDLPNLRSLNLQRNKLHYLEPGSMTGASLEVLNLSQNNFTQLPTDLMTNISSLQLEINMSRNKLTALHSGDLSHVTLKTLYLVGNKIEVFEPEAMKDSFIEKLDLQQNKLQNLSIMILGYTNQSTTLLLSNNPWSCDCDIQWLASMLANVRQASIGDQQQDPVCATPRSLLGWPIRMVYNDLQVACNNPASIPVPTKWLPVPPRQDIITPLLWNMTKAPPELETAAKGSNSTVAIIITVVVLVFVAFLVAMVIVVRVMSRSRRLPEFTVVCKKPDVNFRPRFSLWSLTEPLDIEI